MNELEGFICFGISFFKFPLPEFFVSPSQFFKYNSKIITWYLIVVPLYNDTRNLFLAFIVFMIVKFICDVCDTLLGGLEGH